VGDDFSIEADRSQAAQMAQNLISNALKYHRPGQTPRIRVRLTTGEREKTLSIEDDGMGFPSAQAEDIFQPFRRLHDRGEIPGTGIGLAICKAIAGRHGWRISARSTPGAGATFHIAFPKNGGASAG
jgi:signal transduction histidine kinase